ncbi:MAG TPA: WecB/TagA/CpsF family glycosyltransferase [Acidimicrobiia bacterium]|nr:WecB/TagA/CpsF family glycosyltransferase [Acidimicrobiia bacterium]
MPEAPAEPTKRRNRVELFGVQVDALTLDDTIAAARAMIATGQPHQHVVLNAAKVVEMAHDPALRRVVQGCDLVNADGMAVVWAGRVLHAPLPERVAGIDLFERLVRAARDDGYSVYFLGATDEVVERTVEAFTARYPGLRVAGSRNGYWDDDSAVIEQVRSASPDILFLAIPSPRKEFWLNEHLHALGVPFVMGVGGSFDVIAGKVSRAPQWMQRSGLEWAWRLVQEPRRMWRRYLFTNSAFIRMTWHEWWKGRR